MEEAALIKEVRSARSSVRTLIFLGDCLYHERITSLWDCFSQREEAGRSSGQAFTLSLEMHPPVGCVCL